MFLITFDWAVTGDVSLAASYTPLQTRYDLHLLVYFVTGSPVHSRRFPHVLLS